MRNKIWIALGVAIAQMVTFLSPVALASQPLDIGDIAVDEAHFPDEAFQNWILNPSNLNGFGSDGILTFEERNHITEMNLSDQNIGDLTGIEYFPSLSILTCTQNRLQNLDLSQNTLLEELYCSSNQLTKLDLSNNHNLKISILCL